MKIIQVFPGKVWGGAEQFVLDLGQTLSRQGHNVIYLTRDRKAVTERLEGVVPFETLPFKRFFDHTTPDILQQQLQDADVIHIHDIKFLHTVVKAKQASHSNAHIVLTRHIARGSRVMPWNRIDFRHLHRMLFVSNLAKQLWTDANQWMDRERCVVVHNSIPPANAEDTEESLRRKHDIPQSTPLIVFTGRVRKSKGCEVLLQALAGIREKSFALVFIGTCKPKDYEQRLRSIAKQYGIADKVHFHGFSHNVRQLIKEADIGVAPSIVREACPLAPMEFMQAGKCIITTDNGAQPEYITGNQNGILVPPRDADRLRDALHLVLTDEAMRHQLGQCAYHDFHHHLAYDAFVQKIISSYN